MKSEQTLRHKEQRDRQINAPTSLVHHYSKFLIDWLNKNQPKAFFSQEKDFGHPKGKGIVAGKFFNNQDFVAVYDGELMDKNEACLLQLQEVTEARCPFPVKQLLPSNCRRPGLQGPLQSCE